MLRGRFTLIALASLGALRIFAWVLGTSWFALGALAGSSSDGALPSYRLEIAADSTPVRSDSILTIRISPDVPVVGPVAMKAFLADSDRRGSRARAWTARFDASESGAFILHAPIRDLPGVGPGRFHLTFLVGRPGAPAEGGWTQLSGDLEITAR